MASKYSHVSKRKKKAKAAWGDIAGYLYVIVIISVFAVPYIYNAIDDRAPRNVYLKEIQINGGTVEEKNIDYGITKEKYYIRVSVAQPDNGKVAPDDSWVEVDQSFYNSHQVGSEAGIMLGNYDVYKEKFWGLFGQAGQNFEKNMWGIERMYSSTIEANSANPQKKYSGKATVEEKVVKDNGERYLVLNAEGRSASVPVDQEIYDNNGIGQEIQCDFEAVGEFVKITGVSK